MRSCLYEGWVSHQRSRPIEHGFRYRLVLFHFDLDELHTVFAGRWLWSTRWPALVWFRRADHYGEPHEPLAESIRRLLHEREHEPATGPIRLLTQPRYFGYVMNPVSFYFCYSPDEALRYVVAEVNNTPWGERHMYVLPCSNNDSACEVPKVFHVSPFLALDMQYQWRLTRPDDSWSVDITNVQNGERVFSAHMRLERRPLTTWTLWSALVRFPLMTQRLIVAIYWQAFLLWSKGCRYYPHPRPTS